jgi:hypothetical protein
MRNSWGFQTETSIDPSKGGCIAAGIIPFSNNDGFSYTSTTTTITWSWSGMKIYRCDGTVTAVPDGSQLFTGLVASTTYYFYPYWDEPTQTLLWVSGPTAGHGSPAFAYLAGEISPTLAQQQALTTRIPLSTGSMSAATPASGTGGGTGGGGGGTGGSGGGARK